MNEKRKSLLIELEKIVGNEFYNGNIQNWGPGGVFEGEGRALRYPVTFRDKDGTTIKTKHVYAALPADAVITGMYRLGANELSIMRARISSATTVSISARRANKPLLLLPRPSYATIVDGNVDPLGSDAYSIRTSATMTSMRCATEARGSKRSANVEAIKRSGRKAAPPAPSFPFPLSPVIPYFG